MGLVTCATRNDGQVQNHLIESKYEFAAGKAQRVRSDASTSAGSCRERTFFNKPTKQTKEPINMEKQTQAVSDAMGTLAEDARALMAATADVAGEKVGEARKRLAAALERGKEIAGCVRDKAVEGAKAADEVVREHPYQAIAIGVGVGALIGYLVARRGSRNGD